MSNTITITRQEYQDLIDARDHAVAMRGVAAGEEVFTSEQAAAYAAAPTPLAFYRRDRGMTQADLARAVGRSQAFVAQMESGTRVGDVVLYAKLAQALRTSIEDLVPGA
jgi:DNA-binding XRE family transcriptional regulator